MVVGGSNPKIYLYANFEINFFLINRKNINKNYDSLKPKGQSKGRAHEPALVGVCSTLEEVEGR